jgi:ApeA N-terminal domain 1
LKEPMTIEGRWHIHGEDQPAHYGQLLCDPVKGLRLEVKELQSETLDGMLRKGFAHKWRNIALTIQGWNADNSPIRLFGCCDDGGQSKSGIKLHKFFVNRAVRKLAAGDWPEIKSRTYRMYFSCLHEWMDRRWPDASDTTRPDDIEIPVRPGLSVILGAIVTWESKSGRSFEVTRDSWLKLQFTEDQPVYRVRSFECTAVVTFLSLLIGTPVALDDFFFLPEGETEESISERRLLERRGYCSHPKEDKDTYYMRATYPVVADRIADMLARWFALFDNPDMRAVLDLYAAFTFSDLYDTAQFLLLAQALEAYHTACGRFTGVAMPEADFAALKQRVQLALSQEDYRTLAERFVFANQKTYRTKLEEVIASAPAQARTIITDVPGFADVVKNLRNAYTHHVGSRSHDTKAEHDSEIHALTEQAECLLEILLMQEMGAPERALDQIVREHKTTVRIDLSDPKI